MGIAVVRGAFRPAWAADLDDDLSGELTAALRTPGGVAPRGWNRFYFEPYVERVRGFWDLVSHPQLVGLAEHMFGPDWRVVELGCDVPLPGAEDQPWHRDFPMPRATREEGRLTSFAVNASAVDVVDGPFQGVLGTHVEPGDDFEGGMFPPEDRTAELDGRLQAFHAKAGNVSVRSGLMLHRGSAMGIHARMRPVAIVGIVSPDDRAVVDRLADPTDPHPPRIRLSREAWDQVPPGIAAHLSHEIVSDTTASLPPHHTEHSFEGLKMDQRKS
ncbi:phytanoyl-CoA dioxygenase family protein [Cellulomonas sp. ATA003]|uniref:phytanoyl-CoA dioxygenase family protein n=1 Tax=Cellulomonas sp. ATA003 TaxID=3073064 RepID=UPI002873ABB0|nr:phytanoyl-CoA dioxygenase family protein [Cellulomonas sp. ATA003]WNB87165.1 phytanoyl-CoA dioxygenase family protein [Cellulomonas sp. ATA003]